MMRARRICRAATACLGMLAFGLVGAGSAQALAPGSPDATFGGSGVIRLAGGTQLLGVAVQPDGEIVAAGHSQGRVLVERFSATGAIDGTYVGPSGIARAAAIGSDGKLVIAGTSGGAMFAERLTSSLTPDPSFGSGGIATALPGQGGIANGVAIEPDGGVVVAGLVGGGNTRAGVARFAPNGSLLWSEVPGFDNYSEITALAPQADGKIVFVGRQTPLQVTDGLIGRLNPDGSLDTTFSGGVFTYHFPGGGYTTLNAVQVQNDGKIVAAGADAGGPNAVVVRVGPTGAFDPTFGSGGVAALPAAQSLSNNSGAAIGAMGVAIAGGDRIVASGVFDNAGTVFDAAVFALTSAGSPDSSVGSHGTVIGPTNGYEACATAIAPDGSLVSAGNMITGFADPDPCNINSSSAGFVARYLGFGPPPQRAAGAARPDVNTGAAGAIGQTSAVLSGTINPDGLATSYHFEYGTSSRYGASTSPAALAAGRAAVSAFATVRGLAPGTTYHYRLVASNADGTTTGRDMQFTTAPGPPSASTGRATGVGEVAAALNGAVNTGDLATSYHFEYGTRTRYGSRTPTRSARATAVLTSSARVARLKPGTTYHYRIVAKNADGTSYGADRTFKTAPPVTLGVAKPASSYKIGSLTQHGLGLRVRCSQPCVISGSIVISAQLAKRLALGTRQISIAGGRLSLRRAGAGTLRMVLTGKSKTAIGHASSLRVTVRIVAAPSGGGPHKSVSKPVNLVH